MADVARGLAMTEALVVLDCTPSSEELLAFAASWCKDFKLRMVVTAAPAPGTNFTRPICSSTSTSGSTASSPRGA